ncbi:phosphatidylglycerophosphatase A family protein [Leeia oryzae]|uniref:phosphatidylglycerophosphatase A family protein n=1 Tax=Leeia oryzae TaxID=356662 RepID=UPI0003705EB7|nr:phosphatidylglycerophosphatase A [Leeia oryzae]
MTKPNLAFLLQHPAHFLALGFGSGLAPKAPGTFGSIAAWPFYLLLMMFLSPLQILVLSLPLFLLGVYVCGKAGKALGVVDHGAIVWDEIVACVLLFSVIPQTLASQLAGLLLFRFFDILKPWPIRWFDRHLKSGFGVMWDDIVAAIMAWVVFLIGHMVFVRQFTV